MSFFQSEEDVITLGVARLCLSVVCSPGAGDHQHRVWNFQVIDPSSVKTLKCWPDNQTLQLQP